MSRTRSCRRKKRKRTTPPLAYRAEEALCKAVAEATAEYRRNGVPIAIWRDGKVVRIPAEQIEVREPQVEYTVPRKKGNGDVPFPKNRRRRDL